MKILVVGGTRYFGIPMVNSLLQKGHEITIATRGNSKPDFEASVDYVVMDRMDSQSVNEALGGRHFDLIIDKIAYSSKDVKALLENVTCDRYIQMSTCSVYPKDHPDITEDEFPSEKYELHWIDRIKDYQETKRQAERAVFEFMDPENISFVRYPIVMGENDYTGRLDFYIEHIRDQKPMNIDDYDKEMAFIYEKDAGEFMAYLADHFIAGPVNGCSKATVKISEIIRYIEKGLGKNAVISEQGDAAPYNGLENTRSFSTEKAESTGYGFRELGDWLYPLMDERIRKLVL
ncbi:MULTISPECIES: NAD-dependent epimerase/dehydratase family protein [unclassified Butyrivibrio]|uniref:NAD-dependent epimerase/dehydratase family protein n=1 Tax=unclassified Butyrivibrio TaxID=2639466 RepID=UPI0004281940|nr:MULTISPECIES: NAD-dependent epimerase/dehydratase family protein [unclassified Butyrivibrio]SEM13022.1 Nucleoside-diphosphate-sugar epimerase [Butyrivibrio sp. ob235]